MTLAGAIGRAKGETPQWVFFSRRQRGAHKEKTFSCGIAPCSPSFLTTEANGSPRPTLTVAVSALCSGGKNSALTARPIKSRAETRSARRVRKKYFSDHPWSKCGWVHYPSDLS